MRRFAVIILLCMFAQVYAARMMVIHTSNGGRDVYYLSEAEKITFNSIVGIDNPGRNTVAAPVTSLSVLGNSVVYSVAHPSAIRIDLLDPSGRLICRFNEPVCNSGTYRLNLAGSTRIVSGVYLVYASIGKKSFMRTLVITTNR